MTDGHDPSGKLLAFWRGMQRDGALRCPNCGGALKVEVARFSCSSCGAAYPVEGGVPLLLKPADVVSFTDEVMQAFNLPPLLKNRVDAALAPLTRYRTTKHPEFANFFTKLATGENAAPARPPAPQDLAASVAQVECLTHEFPPELPSARGEYRSIRLRNRSNHTLFTDAQTPLYLGCRVFGHDGEALPWDGELSRIPSPLRPGAELTVPVMVRPPTGADGRYLVRFHFLLIQPAAAGPAPEPKSPARGRIAAWRDRLAAPSNGSPEAQVSRPADRVTWFDAAPLAEMEVSVTAGEPGFPGPRRDRLADFEVQEDIGRAERFLSGVVERLQEQGVPRPRILEVGAGVHPISLRSCGEHATVVVSDISLVMQTVATIMHARHPAVLTERAGFASVDMMHPPFADGTFDLICICAAMHHIADPVEFLRRLAPLLSGRGRFVAVREPCIVNPAEPTYISELDRGYNEQMFELSEWRDIVTRGGFVLEDSVIDYDCSLKFSARLPH